jgi:hypothetical protein
VAVGGVSLLGGFCLLPRRPQADITEFRFARAGWPEVYCRSVQRSLTFEERETAWALPAGSFVLRNAAGSSRSAGREWVDEAADGVMREVGGVRRGQRTIDETAVFRSLPLPVAPAVAAGGGRGLRVLAPMQRMRIWADGGWRRVGDVQAGQVLEAPFEAGRTNRVAGLPARIQDAFPCYDANPGPCRNCGKVHAPDPTLVAAFSNAWIVVAQAAEPAAAAPLMPRSQTESRVIWIVQVPLDAAGGGAGGASP